MHAKILFSCLFLVILQHSLAVEVGPWDRVTSRQITGTISFPNPSTLAIEGFSFSGLGIVVFLYYYAPGQEVDDHSGTILPLSSGGSRGEFNRAYSEETLLVPLPEGMTACNIGTLTIWDELFTATFSRVTIPRNIFFNNGEGECQLIGGNTDLPNVFPTSFENCESFSDDTIQVSWTVDNDHSEVDFQICGCRPLDPDVNEYMAFGLSGLTTQTFMIGADTTVAWVDNREGTPNAVDYYLTQRVQCRAGEGACPDTMVTRNGRQCTDDVRSDSIAGGIREGTQQCVMFSRPFSTGDDDCDTDIDPTNMNQYIVWANGGLGETAFRHFRRAQSSAPPIHLGRVPLDQCTSRPIMCASCPPFIGQRMNLPEDTTLRVHIGPAAGERGYVGITGQPGWGISWYINGTLIPELVVQRNRTYTFIVEGGTDADDLSRYHPFYITDSINGGRLQNPTQNRAEERVFAGFDEQDNPTGVGHFCEVQETMAARITRETCGSLEDYLEDLDTDNPTCDPGQPGIFTWTPDESTPDVVYYQCATHLNLGWRIIVQGCLSTTDSTDGGASNSSTAAVTTERATTSPSEVTNGTAITSTTGYDHESTTGAATTETSTTGTATTGSATSDAVSTGSATTDVASTGLATTESANTSPTTAGNVSEASTDPVTDTTDGDTTATDTTEEATTSPTNVASTDPVTTDLNTTDEVNTTDGDTTDGEEATTSPTNEASTDPVTTVVDTTDEVDTTDGDTTATDTTPTNVASTDPVTTDLNTTDEVNTTDGDTTDGDTTEEATTSPTNVASTDPVTTDLNSTDADTTDGDATTKGMDGNATTPTTRDYMPTTTEDTATPEDSSSPVDSLLVSTTDVNSSPSLNIFSLSALILLTLVGLLLAE